MKLIRSFLQFTATSHETVRKPGKVIIYAGAFRGQKGASFPLELEVQAAVSCLTVVLGSECGSPV